MFSRVQDVSDSNCVGGGRGNTNPPLQQYYDFGSYGYAKSAIHAPNNSLYAEEIEENVESVVTMDYTMCNWWTDFEFNKKTIQKCGSVSTQFRRRKPGAVCIEYLYRTHTSNIVVSVMVSAPDWPQCYNIFFLIMMRMGNLLPDRVEMDEVSKESNQGLPSLTSVKADNTILTNQAGQVVDNMSIGIPRSIMSEDDYVFERIVDRWIPLDTVKVDSNFSIKSWELPSALYTLAPDLVNILPFRAFVYSRPSISVRIVVNGYKMAVGKLILSHLNDPYNANAYNLSVKTMYQREHVLLDLATNAEGVMQIPFNFHRSYIRNSLGSKVNSAGYNAVNVKIVLMAFSPLKVVAPNPSIVNVRVFLKFNDLPLNAMTFQETVTQMDVIDESVDGIKQLIHGVEKIMSPLGLNLDKPTDLQRTFVIPSGVPHFSAGKGLSMAQTMVMNPTTLTSYRDVKPMSSDPVTVLDVARKWGYINSVEWLNTQEPGTVIATVVMDPTARSYTEDKQDVFTPLEYICSMYQFWSGTMELRIDFVSNLFHSGSIMISLEYGRKTTNSETDYESASTYTKVFHLGEQKSVTMVIPYLYDTPWRRSNGAFYDAQYFDPNSVNKYAAIEMGHRSYSVIKIRVINKLVPISSIAQSIQMMCFWRAGPDFMVHGLKNSHLLMVSHPYVMANFPASLRVVTEMESIDETASFKPGHSLRSFITLDDQTLIKDIFRKPVLLFSDIVPPVDPGAGGTLTGKGWFIPLMPPSINWSGVKSGVNPYVANTPFAMLVSMFRFWRGTLRYTIVQRNGPTVGVLYATHVPHSGVRMIGEFSASPGVAGKPIYYTGLFTEMNVLNVNASFTVECPYVTENNWSLCVGDNLNTGKWLDLGDYNSGHLVLNTTATDAHFDVWVAAGDDFEVSYFLGVPTTYVDRSWRGKFYDDENVKLETERALAAKSEVQSYTTDKTGEMVNLKPTDPKFDEKPTFWRPASDVKLESYIVRKPITRGSLPTTVEWSKLSLNQRSEVCVEWFKDNARITSHTAEWAVKERSIKNTSWSEKDAMYVIYASTISYNMRYFYKWDMTMRVMRWFRLPEIFILVDDSTVTQGGKCRRRVKVAPSSPETGVEKVANGFMSNLREYTSYAVNKPVDVLISTAASVTGLGMVAAPMMMNAKVAGVVSKVDSTLERFSERVDSLGEGAEDMCDKAQTVMEDLSRTAQSVTESVSESMQNMVQMSGDLTSSVTGAVQSVTDSLGPLLDSLKQYLDSFFGPLRGLFGGVCDWSRIIMNVLLDIFVSIKTGSWLTIGVGILRFVSEFVCKGFSYDFMGLAERLVSPIRDFFSADAVAQVATQSSYVATLCSVVALMFGVKSLVVDDLPFFSSLMKGVAVFSGASMIFRFVMQTFETLKAMLQWLLGYQSIEARCLMELRDTAKLESFVNRATDIINPVNERAYKSISFRRKYWITVMEAMRYRKMFSLVDDKIKSPTLNKLCLDVVKHSVDHMTDMICAPTRYEPYVICLEGESAVGKSTLADDLAAELLRAQKLERPMNGMVFNRTPKKFWDGYQDQPVIKYDDWMNIRNPEEAVQTISELYELKTVADFLPSMAAVEEKKIRGNPVMVMLLTNDAYPEDVIACVSSHKEAVLRRRNLVVKVTMKPEIKELLYDEAGAARVDENGVQITLERVMQGRPDRSHLLFQFYKGGCIKELVGGLMDYGEFLTHIKAYHAKYHVIENAKYEERLRIIQRSLYSPGEDVMELKDPLQVFYGVQDQWMDDRAKTLMSERLAHELDRFDRSGVSLATVPNGQVRSEMGVNTLLEFIRGTTFFCGETLNRWINRGVSMSVQYMKDAMRVLSRSIEHICAGCSIPKDAWTCCVAGCHYMCIDCSADTHLRNKCLTGCAFDGYAMVASEFSVWIIASLRSVLKTVGFCLSSLQSMFSFLQEVTGVSMIHACSMVAHLTQGSCPGMLDALMIVRNLAREKNSVYAYKCKNDDEGVVHRVINAQEGMVFENVHGFSPRNLAPENDIVLPVGLQMVASPILIRDESSPGPSVSQMQSLELVDDSLDFSPKLGVHLEVDWGYVETLVNPDAETKCFHAELMEQAVTCTYRPEDGAWRIGATVCGRSQYVHVRDRACSSVGCPFRDIKNVKAFVKTKYDVSLSTYSVEYTDILTMDKRKQGLDRLPRIFWPSWVHTMQEPLVGDSWWEYLSGAWSSWRNFLVMLSGIIVSVYAVRGIWDFFFPGQVVCELGTGSGEVRDTPRQSKFREGLRINKLTRVEAADVVEAVMDKIQKNYVVIQISTGPLKYFDIIALGMRGHMAVMPAHYMPVIRDYGRDSEVVFRITPGEFYNGVPNAHSYCYVYSPSDFREVPDLDLVVFEMPNNVPMFRDIVKYVPSIADLVDKPISSHGYFLKGPTRDSHVVRVKDIEISGFVPDFTCRNVYNSEDVITNDVLKYNYSHAGHCGSAVLLSSTQRPLVAIHVAGNTVNGYGVILVQEVLSDYLNRSLCEMEQVEFPVEVDPWPETNLMVLGAVKPELKNFVPAKTKLQPSVLFDCLPVKHVKEPAILSEKDKRYRYEKTPLWYGVAKHNASTINFRTDWISDAAEAYMSGWLGPMRPLVVQPRRLTIVEAIVGFPDLEYYEGIKLNTSAGYPWTVGQCVKDKTRLIHAILNDQKQMVDCCVEEELLSEIRRKEALRCKGIVPMTYFCDTLKDEKRSVAKLMQPGGTRLFSASPVDYTIAMRQNFLHFCAAFMSARFGVMSAIGVNPHSGEWHALYARLVEKSRDNIIQLDYSNFGPGFNAQVALFAENLFIDWTLKNVQGVDELELRACMRECTNSAHIAGATVYRQFCGSPSGAVITTIINSIVNILYVMVAWKQITGAPYTTFRKEVSLIVYGDDLIMSVTDAYVGLWNSVTIRNWFDKYGITVTAADKEAQEEMKPTVRIEEAQFLKRGFLRHPFRLGSVLAPLSVESIYETTQWIWTCANRFVATQDNCAVALLEAHGHGPGFFSKFKRELNEACISRGIQPSLLVWDQIDNLWAESKLTVFDEEEVIW